MHNDRNHLEDQNILFLSEEAATFYTIDCESPPDNAPCSRPLPQLAARPPQYMRYMRILTSYHGLVCLRIEKNVPERKNNVPTEFDIIMWNPVTTEYKRLSRPSNPDHMECYIDSGYGLYYTSGEDDYKLLVVTDSGKVYIYSLKSDSLDTKPPFQDFWSPGFFFNKNLYFLSDIITEGSMRFDTKAKRFHKIKTPPVSPHKGATSITLEKGSIHYCAMYDYMIELWKIVLSVEDKLDYLEQPIPPAPVPAQSGQQVALDALAAHAAWVKGSKEIAGLMLITMESDIQ
ncbi:hypothetical protein Tco_0972292 [Tanacetum coccineum]